MSNRCRTVTMILSLILVAASTGCSEDHIQEVSYTLIDSWAQLPEGVEAWGQTIGLEIDRDGNLLVFQRCFANNCIGRDDVPTLLKYNPDGNLMDSWGEGLFVWPHGFSLDSDGNVWATDARGMEGKGQQVFKFSPDGTVLMTLGTPGVTGNGPDTFNGPTDVAVAPTGEVFVADGHGNNRIVKYSSDGEFLMEWGKEGTGPGEFNEPHCLAFDSRGRLFVGDRVNQRIQLFDQDGRYLDEWPGIMASGIHITEDDVVYVADYQLQGGIVITEASGFSAVGFISETLPEGVTVDAQGNVYAGEVIPRNLKKFAKTFGPPASVPKE